MLIFSGIILILQYNPESEFPLVHPVKLKRIRFLIDQDKENLLNPYNMTFLLKYNRRQSRD